MAVTLRVRSGLSSQGSAQEPAITLDLPRIVIGRGEGCDLRLPDLSVSHRHATIRQRGAEYIVLDEDSTNGTYLGSVRLHAQSPRVLRDHDLIRLGRVWVQIRFTHSAPAAQPALATRELALALVAGALEQQGESARPRLVCVSGPDQGKSVDLSELMRPFVLGRGREADLPLELADASRRHAQVMRKGDQLLVRDLGSRNGTHAAFGAVPIDRDAALRPGDTLTIAQDEFVFEHPAVEALKELEHASDEPVDARDLPPPPTDTPPQAQPPPATVEVVESRAESISQPTEPPPPRAPACAPRSPARSGWTKTDLAVVLLALVVLVLSVIGLYWLFHAS